MKKEGYDAIDQILKGITSEGTINEQQPQTTTLLWSREASIIVPF